MSETDTEREVEIVTGTIKGVIVKGVDKWQVEVQPDGSEYTKKLWTKDAALVEAIPPKIGQAGAFVCGASYWTNNDGKQVRSLWIQQEGTDGVTIEAPESPRRVATPKAAVSQGSDGMSKEEWARKDSAADKRACIAIAVSALTHTMTSDPTPEDLRVFAERVKTLSHNWHLQVEAVRNGDERDVPFLSARDDGVPY